MSLLNNILSGFRKRTDDEDPRFLDASDPFAGMSSYRVPADTERVSLNTYYDMCETGTVKVGNTYINQGTIYPDRKGGYTLARGTASRRRYYEILRRNNYRFYVPHNNDRGTPYCIEGHF